MKKIFPYSTQDAVECFQNARNLNAAVKKILKSDTSNDTRTSRFCKALKSAIKSPKKEAIAAFVEKAIVDYEEYLFVVLRNAYAPLIDPILDTVIEEYADTFNETYSIDPMSGTISILNEETFKQIGEQALKAISSGTENSELPPNGFMKSAITYSLFDNAVLIELRECLGK